MSDNIPFDIQSEIIKYLPFKSLLQFRTVSKLWKSFIDSPDFIVDYTFHNPNQPTHHFLIAFKDTSYSSICFSIADDNTFPLNKLSVTLPVPVDLIQDLMVVGTSHGLICLCSDYNYRYDFVLWNPSIQKSIPIPLATTKCDGKTANAFGFGVCPVTKDPKLVLIHNTVNTWKIVVFSLHSGVWRISSSNLLNKSVQFHWYHGQVTIDPFVYWFGFQTNADDDGDVERNVVISFDLSSEEIEEIHLPGNLGVYHLSSLYLFKRNDSLAVVKDCLENERGVFEVWVMGSTGVSKAFTMVFSVNIPYESCYMSIHPIGFNKNGDVLMAIKYYKIDEDSYTKCSKVVVYKPFIESIEGVVIEDEFTLLVACSYTESLLLSEGWTKRKV